MKIILSIYAIFVIYFLFILAILMTLSVLFIGKVVIDIIKGKL